MTGSLIGLRNSGVWGSVGLLVCLSKSSVWGSAGSARVGMLKVGVSLVCIRLLGDPEPTRTLDRSRSKWPQGRVRTLYF